MSEDIKSDKPQGTGLFDSDDVDTRMEYKETQRRQTAPDVDVKSAKNRQKEKNVNGD